MRNIGELPDELLVQVVRKGFVDLHVNERGLFFLQRIDQHLEAKRSIKEALQVAYSDTVERFKSKNVPQSS